MAPIDLVQVKTPSCACKFKDQPSQVSLGSTIRLPEMFRGTLKQDLLSVHTFPDLPMLSVLPTPSPALFISVNRLRNACLSLPVAYPSPITLQLRASAFDKRPGIKPVKPSSLSTIHELLSRAKKCLDITTRPSLQTFGINKMALQ